MSDGVHWHSTKPKGYTYPNRRDFRGRCRAPHRPPAPNAPLLDRSGDAWATGQLGHLVGAHQRALHHGLKTFTGRPGTLSNDFFINLLDMSTRWTKSASADGIFDGVDRATGKVKWTATPVDLAIGSQAELRAIAEVYAENGGEAKFVQDFVKAWTKMMNLDRFDLRT